MTGISEEPASTPDSCYERTRLGIRHLLLWTACTAAFLAAVTMAYPEGSWSSTLFALHSMGAGCGLAGLVLVDRPRFRRGCRAPGETLLQITGLFYLTVVLALFAKSLADRHDPHLPSDLQDVIISCGILFGVFSIIVAVFAWVMLVVDAFQVRARRWRFFFGLLFTLPIAILSWWFVDPADDVAFVPTLALLVLVVLGVVAWLDVRQSTRYPWTHWAGVLSCGWASLAVFVMAAVEWMS